MSTTYYYFLLYFILPIFVSSCSTYNFSCGNYTLQIQYPFVSAANPQCIGLHKIRCMNLVPVIQLQGFFYPVWNISYHEKSFVIHDLKLSSYFRESGCVFLYDFAFPVPRFNVSNVTEYLSSRKGFFDCQTNRYDFSHDVFRELFNLSSCKDYSLDYSYNSDSSESVGAVDGSPSYCLTSSDIWFDWRLSFDEGDDGNVSLLSAGFSRKWTPFPDCFSCQIVAGNCSYQCRGMKPSSGRSSSKKAIIGIVCGLGGFILACALCFFCYKRKLKKHTSSVLLSQDISSKSFSKKDLESISFHCQTHLFSYQELEEATNGFDASKELGDGGYGTVYKGVLRDGRIVAVKRLYETSYKRVEQFLNEVEILSRLRHPNLVTLYGSTSPNSPHLLLVYEYVSNGTVADHLHNPLRSKSLSLSLRLSMAIDTAAALSYLHSIDIIHRDVKTHNILVDNSFNVKVADFGLSRLFPPNATHVSTAPQGTPGYLDPEYHRFYQLTDKSDVYSFGVVLMELISSRPAVDIDRRPNEISLAMASINKIQNGELDQLVDPGLGFNSDQEVNRTITQMAELAFRCLQMDREMRPSIKEVLEGLKEIQQEGVSCNNEQCEVKVREESRLLKNSVPFSPDSVMNKWMSRSTTPNTSNQGII